uniref:DUF3991 domain-containing protein n=1 Tax=Carnobacterium sp. TaxID=48221 RepID=UPI00344E6F8F
MYTDEQIKQAEQIDIIDYCTQNGIEFEEESQNYFRMVEHNSCVVNRKKNMFYWNSRGENGNVISFLRKYEGLGFKEAVAKLLNEEYEKSSNVEYVHEPYDYNSSNEVDHIDHVLEYLTQERKIDPELVKDLNEKGFIKQDKRKNVLFLWKDYERTMGCTEQGTIKIDTNKRGSWKSIQKNSTTGYGFNVKYGEPKNLKFFESPIDLLSYATLNKNKLKDTHLVSIEGTKESILLSYLMKTVKELGDAPDSVAICVDNDNAGDRLMERLKHVPINKNDGSIYDITPERPTIAGCKDWNDQLKVVVSNRDEQLRRRRYYQNTLER